MSTRLAAALAALALVPAAALAQEAAAADPSVLEGKVESLAEQVTELKNDVGVLKRLKFSGYVQARWAWQELANYNTSIQGTATTPANPPAAPLQQGVFIRRGRLKAVYDADWSQYVVQIDVIPAGVTMKEGYATVKLPMGMAIDAGLQLFPFGYEVASRSSSDLDTLERSAVTVAYLGGEYDLGVALRGKNGPVAYKVGLFNGNGSVRTNGYDNDQLKDVIGRATVDLGMVTAGVSGWYGKSVAYSRDDDKTFDRYRAAVDAQVFLDLLPVGGTALKGEWMWGRNTIGGTVGVGGTVPTGTSQAPVPTGHGWYASLLQNVGQTWQAAARYEQFVPNNTVDLSGATNTKVKRRDEIQLALHAFIGSGMKLSGAWYHPMNGEKGAAAPSDPKADSWIVQAQARF